MLKIGVKFSGDTKERIEALINGLAGKRGVLMGKIAKRLEADLRDKFVSNGGKSFWQDASRSIFKSNTDSTASVVVNKPGVALQYYGGTVRPKRAKNLAIPMRAEFRGKNPRELTGKRLFVFGQYRAAGRRFLAYKDGAAVRVAYLLTPKAVIKPHRDKFLTDREIISGAEETIKTYTKNCYGLSIH